MRHLTSTWDILKNSLWHSSLDAWFRMKHSARRKLKTLAWICIAVGLLAFGAPYYLKTNTETIFQIGLGKPWMKVESRHDRYSSSFKTMFFITSPALWGGLAALFLIKFLRAVERRESKVLQRDPVAETQPSSPASSHPNNPADKSLPA